ncbi:MAG: AarF/UbiB family protein [Desulfobacterales bacterium]|jgi:ubiquinone biosynthesis protein|nr:AarF/UbiB family protein [Desulfobacterales bacterium]
MLNLTQIYQHVFSDLSVPAPKDAIIQRIKTLAGTVGADRFRALAAQALIKQLDPAGIIPSVYSAYRSIIHDGLTFFLSRISFDRIVDMIADQMLLTDTGSREQRLVDLAQKCPTLHKLGQIIARNQHIHPNVRKWFVHLESGDYGTSIEKILPHVVNAVQSDKELFSIQFGRQVLSEASVGAVCPFWWKDPESGAMEQGVFKVLKPGMRSLLAEELNIIDALAAFFQDRTDQYPLDDFRYIEVFRDIGRALAEEINLIGEQAHLWDAYHFYQDSQGIEIPKLAPFSTHNVTAMSRLIGVKITDAPMEPPERKLCATRLFKAIILKPLFSPSDTAIFHGDPHAGNILAHKTQQDQPATISLIDWSLAGHLEKSLRIRLLQLFLQVVMGKADDIGAALMGLCIPALPNRDLIPRLINGAIAGLIATKEYAESNLLKKVFCLIDRAARSGMVFRTDLLLFRKTWFTLEGVLYELDPDFDFDAVMTASLQTLFLREIPKRLRPLLFPAVDRPERYASMLTNKDIQRLLLHHALSGLKTGSVKILAIRHFLSALGAPLDPPSPCGLAV